MKAALFPKHHLSLSEAFFIAFRPPTKPLCAARAPRKNLKNLIISVVFDTFVLIWLQRIVGQRDRFLERTLGSWGGQWIAPLTHRSISWASNHRAQTFSQCCLYPKLSLLLRHVVRTALINNAVCSYQGLDLKVTCRLTDLRLELLGFLGGAVRFFRRSARSTRTETSPYSTNGARYCGAMMRSNQGRRKTSTGIAPHAPKMFQMLEAPVLSVHSTLGKQEWLPSRQGHRGWFTRSG